MCHFTALAEIPHRATAKEGHLNNSKPPPCAQHEQTVGLFLLLTAGEIHKVVH